MARKRNRSVFSNGPTTTVGGRILQMSLLMVLLVMLAGALFLGFGDFQPEPTITEKPVALQPLQ